MNSDSELVHAQDQDNIAIRVWRLDRYYLYASVYPNGDIYWDLHTLEEGWEEPICGSASASGRAPATDWTHLLADPLAYLTELVL